ncbi:MAG: hypothetical protein AAGA48_33420 [Myxococcota bacterium]
MMIALLWSMACTNAPVADDAPSPSREDTGTIVEDRCGPMTFELGSGFDVHRPLTNGDSITMVHGAQGGWHIDISGLASTTGTWLAIAPVVTRKSDGLRIAGDQSVTYVDAEAVDECTSTFAGVRAFLDDHDPTPQTNLEFLCSLDGETFEVEVTATDVDSGTGVTEQRDFVLYADPLDYCDLL